MAMIIKLADMNVKKKLNANTQVEKNRIDIFLDNIGSYWQLNLSGIMHA